MGPNGCLKIIIDDKLATHAIEDIGWDSIEKRYLLLGKIEGWTVLDCRVLEDGPGNPLSLYSSLIESGCMMIDRYGKVLVGCTAGISRSNAIAAGILMKGFGYSYYDALDLVHKKVKIDLIEQAHLNALKKLFL
jgi:hypothetical protein